MPVRQSRRTDLGGLLAGITSHDAIERDSAAARLVVAGRRALGPLTELVEAPATAPALQAAALRIVWQIDRREGVVLAGRVASGDDSSLALAAVGILSQALSDPNLSDIADEALEHLTRLALDRRVDWDCRQAAVAAIRTLPGAIDRPLLDALAAEALGPAEPASGTSGGAAERLALWCEHGHLPETPEGVDAAVRDAGDTAPVTVLLRLVALAREREEREEGGRVSATAGESWALVRDRLHEALATRGSTIARFDLREALESLQRPASTHLLSAAMVVADESCLEGVTSRWLDANRDAWLRDQLERLFRNIVVREGLRRRSAPLVRLLKRHPSAGALIATAPRTLHPAGGSVSRTSRTRA